jgi:ribosome-binding factor A
MTMDGIRPIRVAEQIRQEIIPIVEYELNDSRIGFVTVTDVEVTPDLKLAKIFVSVMPGEEGNEKEKETSLQALNHAAGYIRRELGARLRLRYTPQLSFLYDHSIERGNRIEELLKEEAARMNTADESAASVEPVPSSDESENQS